MVKTFGWLSPEKLKFINDNPQVVSLLYDLGLLPEEISARVRGYVEEERERCAKIADVRAAECDQSAKSCDAKGINDHHWYPRFHEAVEIADKIRSEV